DVEAADRDRRDAKHGLGFSSPMTESNLWMASDGADPETQTAARGPSPGRPSPFPRQTDRSCVMTAQTKRTADAKGADETHDDRSGIGRTPCIGRPLADPARRHRPG